MTRGRPNPKHLGLPARLKRARKSAKLTGHALSLAAGLSHTATKNIEENGAVPRIDLVARLAAALGRSPCSLAFGAEREAGEVDTSGVGARLREARARAGLTRSALGQQSGMSGQNVANIEDRGVMPGLDTVEQLAKALGVSVCWLAFGEAEAPPGQAPAPTAAGAKIQALLGELGDAPITAADVAPLVDRMSPKERARLVDHARRRRPPAA